MTVDPECFSSTYALARRRFLTRAQAAGLELASQVLPLRGAEGEELALDVAWHGLRAGGALLVVSSGCHGIEGYAGSAAQCALLQDGRIAAAARRAGVGLLYLHALNPHGFSRGRRVTQENIDLNRNFVDFSQPLPANPDYERLAPLLLPPRWPPSPGNALRLAGFVLRHGPRRARAAVSSGQYGDERGLFFGGCAPAWSQLALRRVLRTFAAGCARLAWVDVHTGLGRCGDVEWMLAARNDPATLARARAWWGERVTSTGDGRSASPALHGQMWSVMYDECPGAECTGVALEFGTVSRLEALQALRGDHWLALHPQAPPHLQRAIRRRMREAFWPAGEHWRRNVVQQVSAAVAAGLGGLDSAR